MALPKRAPVLHRAPASSLMRSLNVARIAPGAVRQVDEGAEMDLELEGKTAIVTGGSRGIGKAVARQLAREGVQVVIASRGAEALEATAHELSEETGRRVIAVPADTTDDESVRGLVAGAVYELGHVDILVNSAARVSGGGRPPMLEEITHEAFLDEMNTKVFGYLRCAREVAPLMKAQGWGRIINLSGLAARSSGSALGSMRNVSVAALTKNLADELGPHGINVTVVHPGTSRTERTPAMIAAAMERDGVTAEEAERRMANNSIRRLVSAEEIADVIAFLASPRAVAINGDAVAVGGGAGNAIYY
jgi:NAD(P)-dependent dehydrogenase (short-subunit alcohol dehydrogenase family)